MSRKTAVFDYALAIALVVVNRIETFVANLYIFMIASISTRLMKVFVVRDNEIGRDRH